jgi:hypothetical protein
MKRRFVITTAMMLALCSSSYAERISIFAGRSGLACNGHCVQAPAVIIDHKLNFANRCTLQIDQNPRKIITFCENRTYQSMLPADAEISSSFTPEHPAAINPHEAYLWEADQNAGDVQVCVIGFFPATQSCTILKLVH